MKIFDINIEECGEVLYHFECYDNTEPINVGDQFLFFFAGVANVGLCETEEEKIEINPNSRTEPAKPLDFITGFWQNCYKIKSTNFQETRKLV